MRAEPEKRLPELIRQMMVPEFYPHPVRVPIRLKQTHISYVLLTGLYAYKVKKPVDLDFLDFTHMSQRKYYCEEELRLNKRMTQDFYVDVLPIRQTAPDSYSLAGGSGKVAEYVLRMREFSQQSLFSNLFKKGKLRVSHMEELGALVAETHRTAPTNDRIQAYGSFKHLAAVAEENYQSSMTFIGRVQSRKQLEETKAFTDHFFKSNTGWLLQRQAEDRIRECHGDLHLNNVFEYESRVQVFDCIEFNETFRLIDVLYDIAFMTVDLEFRGRRDLGYAFLNTYLEHTGDYRGAVLLPLYHSLRAYVRAKIFSQLMDDPQITGEDKQHAAFKAQTFYHLAWRHTRPRKPRLWVAAGLSGSGKSTIAAYLARNTGAIHIRADVIRKHLAGIHMGKQGGPSLYSSKKTKKTYQRLMELGVFLAREGIPVIIEGEFDLRSYRDLLASNAKDQNIPLTFFHCHAPESLLRERLEHRADDAPNAIPDLIRTQKEREEPICSEEEFKLIRLDMSGDWQPGLADFISDDTDSAL